MAGLLLREVVRCGGTGGGRVKVSMGLVRMRGCAPPPTLLTPLSGSAPDGARGGAVVGAWGSDEGGLLEGRSSEATSAWEQRVLTELRSSVARPSQTQSWALDTGRRGCDDDVGAAAVAGCTVTAALANSCGRGNGHVTVT